MAGHQLAALFQHRTGTALELEASVGVAAAAAAAAAAGDVADDALQALSKFDLSS